MQAKSIAEIVANLGSTVSTRRELAVALHDYVRDTIQFGFTHRFDKASAEYTLDRGIGHCAPQTELFVRLLREAGFEDAKVVSVPIGGTVLNFLGAGNSSPFPDRLQHSFTRVTVDGRECNVDSYVVDKPLYKTAKSKLANMVAAVSAGGYGIHRDGVVDWDGKGDSFSQYVPSIHSELLEKEYDSVQDLITSPTYLHRNFLSLLAVPLFGRRYAVGYWLEEQNSHIDSLRR